MIDAYDKYGGQFIENNTADEFVKNMPQEIRKVFAS